MGFLKSRLTNKLIVLLGASLIVQVSLFVKLSLLQAEAETAFENAMTAKEISETINRLENHLTETTMLLHGRQMSSAAFQDSRLQLAMNSASTQLAKLRQLTDDDNQFSKIIEDSETAFNDYQKILDEVQKMQNSKTPPTDADKRALSTEAAEKLTTIVDDDLVAAGKQSMNLAKLNTEKQFDLRKSHREFLRIYLFATLALTVLVTMLIFSKVTRRLETLKDNVTLLTDGENLKPVEEKGSDEIAALNNAFISMVEQLKEVTEREKTIVENARDLVFSFDSNGNIVEINQSAKDMLNYEPSELRNTQFSDLINVRSINQTLDWLELAKKQGMKTFETQMLSADGRSIDTLWTAYWSDSDQLTYCVAHDMTARRQLDRIKQDVVVMSTHDLRSPLTAIDNYFEMLQAGAFGEPAQFGREALEDAVDSVRRMMNLINDFLDLEKIGAGMMSLHSVPISVEELFQNCMFETEELAARKHLKIEKSEDAISIVTDEDMIHKVVSRILSYCIHRAQAGSSIRLDVDEAQDTTELIIVTGETSVSAEEAEAIFHRLKMEETDDSFLLGLFVCKSMIELLGGTVFAQLHEDGELSFHVLLTRRHHP